MPRYVQQLYEYDCAVAATINAGKWAGLKYTIKKDYKRITKKIQCDKSGTKLKNFNFFLRKELKDKAKIKKLRKASLSDTKNHIYNGGAALIYLAFEDRFAIGGISIHLCLVSEITNDNKWVIHNFFSGEKTSKISKFEIEECFFNYPYHPKYDTNPIIWLLKKRNEK